MTEKMCLNFVETVQKLPLKYLTDSKILEMNNYIQHGKITTYQHCINVMAISFTLSRFFRIFGVEVDTMTLLIGALLHDFYLYDWHDGRLRKEGLHGFSHPLVAKENAKRYFDVTPKVSNIIESHMFPMTINHPPKSKEALIVNLADKYCAVRETICQRKGYMAIKLTEV